MPPGSQPLILRSLTSARIPYPSLYLGRQNWPGVDAAYFLGGIPMTF